MTSQQNSKPGLTSIQLILSGCFSLLVAFTIWGISDLMRNGLDLQTDLLSLLPETKQSAIVKSASRKLSGDLGDSFVFLIACPNEDCARDSAAMARQLINDNEFARVVDPQQRAVEQLRYFDVLKDYRFRLLSREQQGLLAHGQLAELRNQALQALYNPASVGLPATLAEDPLGLFNHYIEDVYSTTMDVELTSAGMLLWHDDNRDNNRDDNRNNNGASAEDDVRVYALISGVATPNAFNLETQESIQKLSVSLKNKLAQQYPTARLRKAGAVFHAAQASATAKQEISFIAGGSSVGILLLFFLAFRSAKPLLLSLGSLAFGCLCALVICQLVFKQIHLLTLVFGASLIGVAVDYALHYLARSTQTHDTPGTLLSHLLPSLFLGLVTSLIGYANLFQAPLPGLRQMALFSIVGLTAAWLFVVTLFPLVRHKQVTPWAMLDVLAALPENLWARLSRRQAWTLLAIITIPCLLSVNFWLATSSDIRILYHPATALVEDQQAIESLFPSHSPNQFFVVANSAEDLVIDTAAQFRPSLERLKAQGAIQDYRIISDYLPPQKAQAVNAKLLAKVYAPGGAAEAFMQEAGFDAKTIQALQQSFTAMHDKNLSVDDWYEHAPMDLKLLWLGRVGEQYASLILLQGVSDLPALVEAGLHFPGVTFIDTVSELSRTLDEKRSIATSLLVFAYLAIAGLLIVRYRRAGALMLLAVPLLASLITIAGFSAFGIAIGLFHVFALFLVLGLGMDYSIFLYESRDDQQECRLAILLSVSTSCLSFGLLALSSTPMISAFGLTILFGSLLNWLLSPLVILGRAS